MTARQLHEQRVRNTRTAPRAHRHADGATVVLVEEGQALVEVDVPAPLTADPLFL